MAETREWTAKHMYARIGPRKARLLADLIRGLNCDSAMQQLEFNNRRAARMVQAVLRSAMSNADEQEAEMGNLIVSTARVDGGPYQRRWRPKDRGRAHPIQKKTSHIVVTVSER